MFNSFSLSVHAPKNTGKRDQRMKLKSLFQVEAAAQQYLLQSRLSGDTHEWMNECMSARKKWERTAQNFLPWSQNIVTAVDSYVIMPI